MPTDQTQPEKPADVLLVVDDDTYGRMNVVVRHLCVGIMDEPIRMRVLAWNRDPVGDHRIGPIEVFYPPRSGWTRRDPTTVAMTEALGDSAPEVVHCLSAESGCRMVTHVNAWRAHLIVHLTDDHDVEAFASLAGRAGVTAVLTTGALERLFHQRYPDARGVSRTVPLGLPASTSPACLSRPERVPAFVVTRSLTRGCGLDLLLTAWKDVVHLGQETQLFILGHGPAERYFRRIMEKYNLRSHVTFAGDMGSWANLSEAMRGADFFVVPSPPERFTMGILYAMAWGLTVIAPTGLTEDYVIEGQTARLFNPRSAEDLREKMLALLNDHPLARRLAHGGQDYVRSHHQASAMVREMAAVYRTARALRRTFAHEEGPSTESAERVSP
jgi:glycosyltransferase involved in cell wall biosynthesis